MADNTQLNTNTTSGDIIATDDIGGVKHQRVKMEFGGDGVATEVETASSLPISVENALQTGTNVIGKLSSNKSTIATLSAGLTFTAPNTVSVIGVAQDSTSFSKFLLYLDITFNAATTTGNDGRELQIKPQFSNDSGSTWFDYQNNFWGDLRFNDSQGNNSIKRCFSGDSFGKDWRLQAVATNGAYATTTVSTVIAAYVEFSH